MKFPTFMTRISHHDDVSANRKSPDEPAAFTSAKKVIFVLDSVGNWDDIVDLIVADAPFTCQADTLAEVKTIKDWYDWMANFKATIAPDASFTVKSTTWDDEREICTHSAVYHATHTGEGGPVPATGRKASTDYYYEMEMNGDGKVVKMWKIWNDGHCLKQLGWA
eukprot:g7163.t1 g7163   contig23:2026011-2026505(-)